MPAVLIYSFSSSNQETAFHDTHSPKLPVRQTYKQTSYSKQTQANILLNACAQEAIQTLALAQVWAVNLE